MHTYQFICSVYKEGEDLLHPYTCYWISGLGKRSVGFFFCYFPPLRGSGTLPNLPGSPPNETQRVPLLSVDSVEDPSEDGDCSSNH